jgi:hypothetical protein
MQPGWLSCAIWAEGVEWLSCLGIIWALRIRLGLPAAIWLLARDCPGGCTANPVSAGLRGIESRTADPQL